MRKASTEKRSMLAVARYKVKSIKFLLKNGLSINAVCNYIKVRKNMAGEIIGFEMDNPSQNGLIYINPNEIIAILESNLEGEGKND